MPIVRSAFVAALVLTIGLATSVPAGAKGVSDFDRVGIRTTDDDITLRLYVGEMVDYGDPSLPDSCYPDAELQVQVSTRLLANQLWFVWHDDGALRSDAVLAGSMEDDPVAVAIARVPDDVARVEIEFRDGSRDRARPSDGWVALASRVDSVPEDIDRVPLLNQSGSVIGRLTTFDADGERLASEAVHTNTTYDAPPECEPTPLPPPPLPDATGPPPADEAAARKQVVAAFRGTFEKAGDQSDEKRKERLELIEDGASVEEASKEIAGLYPEIGSTEVVIDEIRFLSETEAAVRFDIELEGGPITSTTIGRALLVDGTWKVAKVTYCELLARAGVMC